MKARSVARELALFTLFQLEEKEGRLVWEKQTLRERILQTVRSLSTSAQEEIESSAKTIATILYELSDYEAAHPDNEDVPLDEPLKPVTLPTTQNLRDKLESLLRGLENLNESLELPEVLALSQREDVENYTGMILKQVTTHQQEIDSRIDKASQSWRVERMQKMDRLLLRIGVAEMCYTSGVETATIIDEILELSKRFTAEESRKFIHGILGQVAEDLSQETIEHV